MRTLLQSLCRYESDIVARKSAEISLTRLYIQLRLDFFSTLKYSRRKQTLAPSRKSVLCVQMGCTSMFFQFVWRVLLYVVSCSRSSRTLT